MSEAQKVYLEIYTAAIRGWLANEHASYRWLANEHASYTDRRQTPEVAHQIADRVAKLGAIAIANIGKDNA